MLKTNIYFLCALLSIICYLPSHGTQPVEDIHHLKSAPSHDVSRKIAIIDGVNQDIGLKILFPEADYYIKKSQKITQSEREKSYKKYNFTPKYDWSQINDKTYDYLFIVIALYDAKKGCKFFQQEIHEILNEELQIINKNNFKKVFLFDNYDYSYDPNEIIKNSKIDVFFKRNYSKAVKYKSNVVPFPFIMFGHTSIIEKLDTPLQVVSQESKIDRTFFIGALFTHIDPEINYIRDRAKAYANLKKYLYTPKQWLPYDAFLAEMAKSKFSVDINGVGDPNKRTFEILCTGSLRIGEYNELTWPFPEEFCEETIFKNENEFRIKMENLRNNDELYKKCLDQQNFIFRKYCNKQWIKDYILQIDSSLPEKNNPF